MMSLVSTRHIFRQKSTLLALALASFSSISWATYSDVNSMLQALRPNAPVIAPELNTLILSLDGLNVIPIQHRDALFTLAPAADGSLRVVSESTNHQMYATIFDRVEKVRAPKPAPTGIACGDQRLAYTPKPLFKSDKSSTTTQDATTTTTTNTKIKTNKVVSDADLPSVKDPAASADLPPVKEPAASADLPPVKDTAAKKTDLPAVKSDDASTKATNDLPAVKETATTDAASSTPEVVVTDDTPLIGDILNEPRGAWIQLIGSDTWQDQRENTPGFHAQILGLLIGRDQQINDGLFIGVAGGYQQGDIDTKGLSGSYLDVKRYNATLYGRFDFTNCPIFVQLAFTLALNDYDNNRYILVPPAAGFGFVNIAHGEFDGWETNAHLETGYTFTCKQLRVIPKLILEYSHMEFNNYEEHDAFFLDLNVKYDNMNAFDLGIGAQVDYRNDFDQVSVIPQAHVYLYHDYINAKQVATANFYSGGYAFLSEQVRPSSNTMDFGVAMNIHSRGKTMVKFQYDYVTRSDYHRNEAFIKLRHEWV